MKPLLGPMQQVNDVVWSRTAHWVTVPVRAGGKTRAKINAQAWGIARQVVAGTLPDGGVIASATTEAAEYLLQRIVHYVQILEKRK